MTEFRVARVEDVPPGEGRVVKAGERAVALFHVGEQFYAIDNTCKHRGGPLGEGSLDGEVVTCPWHGWAYRITDGSCLAEPSVSMKVHSVRVEGSDIYVAVE